MKKKFLIGVGTLSLALSLASCGTNNEASTTNPSNPGESSVAPSEATTTSPSLPGESSVVPSEATSIPSSTIEEPAISEDDYLHQGALGYISADMIDYKDYENTDSYRIVTNASELIQALTDARNDYTTTVTESFGTDFVIRQNLHKQVNWERAVVKGLYVKEADGSFRKLPADEPFTSYDPNVDYYEDSPFTDVKYEQTLNKASTVHVIEIANDIDLGWNHLTSADKENSSVVKNFAADEKMLNAYTMSSMFTENGISQIMVERTNDLLVYSKNGSKLTHGGFKVNYSKNVAFRNLQMDEIWQWEDTANLSSGKVGDYDAFGWAYFKIGFSDNIWIDHCTFGKSYDGQIDVSNPTYTSMGTSFMAPYEGDGTSNVHISWCDFKAGSADKDGYLYKMMEEVEADYQAGNSNYLYYKTLRDAGVSFEDILYGIAIPQKKAFLLGDSGDEFKYNKNLTVSIANCRIKNIEDRLPKLRSGNAYFYNNVVDNFEYMNYRNNLLSKDVKNLVKNVNSSWKCALVSQGIVCGNGGSVKAENTIFRGIEYLLKNNDVDNLTNKANDPDATSDGGFDIVGCTYQQTEKSRIVKAQSLMSNATSNTLKNSYFKWNTIDGSAPFTPVLYEIDVLEEKLNNELFGVGVLDNTIDFLISNYNK